MKPLLNIISNISKMLMQRVGVKWNIDLIKMWDFYLKPFSKWWKFNEIEEKIVYDLCRVQCWFSVFINIMYDLSGVSVLIFLMHFIKFSSYQKELKNIYYNEMCVISRTDYL